MRTIQIVALFALACAPTQLSFMLESPLESTQVPRGRDAVVTYRWFEVDGVGFDPTLALPPAPPGVTLSFDQAELGRDVEVRISAADDAPLAAYQLFIDVSYDGGRRGAAATLSFEVVP